MNTNERKAQQLGMPFGTAANRLRKVLLFDMAQRLGEDNCFRCGDSIENVDEFTIEHKVPWFNHNSELFWALDNISFSHSKCNRPHSYTIYKPRIKTAGCGTQMRYKDGCRCDLCREWKRDDRLRWVK